MRTFARALSAERLKMKRTLAMWLALLTPGALVFLEVAAATQHQGNLLLPQSNRWQYMFEDVFSIWVILVFPLFITLETALLGQLEYGNNAWKLVYTQPIPRRVTLAAKQVWGLALVIWGLLVLIGLTLMGGAILNFIMPELNLTLPIPWAEMFRQTGIALLAAGIMLAIHTWIALHFSSFVAASAIGIGMTIAGLVLRGLEWTRYFPWTMPASALYNYYEGISITTFLLMGFVGFLILSLIGNWLAGRLEIKN